MGLMDPPVHGPFPVAITQGLTGNGANAPSLQALQLLDRYMRDFFTGQFTNAYYISFGIAGIILCIMILFGAAVIVHRIWQGKFWVIRIMRRSQGLYVVPNALNVFALLEGGFGLLMFAYVFVIYFGYKKVDATMQHHVDAFNVFVWIPLYLGALYAAVGSFYTAPGALDGRRIQQQSLFHRAVRHPWAINSISLGTPIALLAGVVPCGVLTQRALSRNFETYQVLSSDIAAAVASGRLSPTQAQAFLTRASDLWNNFAVGKWYMSIGYAIWTAFAGLLLLFYIPAGGHMLRLLYIQVQKQRAAVEKIERQQQELLRAEKQRQEAIKPVVSNVEQSPPSNSLLFRPLTDGKEEQLEPRVSSSQTMRDVGESPLLPKRSGTLKRRDNHTEALSPIASDGDVFFPPLGSAQQKKEQFHLSSDAPPVTRWRYLRRAFRSLLLVYLGIIAAAAIYLIIAARLAAQLYNDALSGPDTLTYLVATSHLPTAWAAVVFGGLTLGATWSRFLDANMQEKHASRHSHSFPTPQRRGQMLPRNARPPSCADEAQTLSRALPPMPESVGGGVSQLQTQHMQSQLQSTASMPDIPVIGHRRQSSVAKSEMKFSLATDQHKPGALMMMPVGSEQNSVSNPEEQTSTQRSWRTFMPRSQTASKKSTVRGVPEDVTQASFMSDELQSRPDHLVLDALPLHLAEHQQDVTVSTEDGTDPLPVLGTNSRRTRVTPRLDLVPQGPVMMGDPQNFPHGQPEDVAMAAPTSRYAPASQSAVYPSHASGWPGVEAPQQDRGAMGQYSRRHQRGASDVYAFSGASPSRANTAATAAPSSVHDQRLPGPGHGPSYVNLSARRHNRNASVSSAESADSANRHATAYYPLGLGDQVSHDMHAGGTIPEVIVTDDGSPRSYGGRRPSYTFF
ncbi:unnamed protein product [Parajaminaea phylloscopi]